MLKKKLKDGNRSRKNVQELNNFLDQARASENLVAKTLLVLRDLDNHIHVITNWRNVKGTITCIPSVRYLSFPISFSGYLFFLIILVIGVITLQSVLPSGSKSVKKTFVDKIFKISKNEPVTTIFASLLFICPLNDGYYITFLYADDYPRHEITQIWKVISRQILKNIFPLTVRKYSCTWTKFA